MSAFPILERGSRKRPYQPDFAIGSYPPANFTVATPPGAPAPTAAFSSVPGTVSAPGTNPASMFGVPAVRATAGMPSQEVVVQSHVVNPWPNGYHERLGRGQIIFIARDAKNDKNLQTFASLPQMNEVLRIAFEKAIKAGVIERSTVDADTFGDLKSWIEEDMEDSVARERRHLDEVGKKNRARSNLLTQMKNTNEKFWITTPELKEALLQQQATQYLKYLAIDGILEKWNYCGVIRNIEHADAHFKVLNSAVSGPLDVDNYWGTGVAQTKNGYLVLKRVRGADGDYGQFAWHPWIENGTDPRKNIQSAYPDSNDVYYEDVAGYAQYGAVEKIGKIGSVTHNAQQAGKSSARLAGLAGTATAEIEAWRESSARMKKSSVFMTLTRDAFNANYL